MRDYSDEKIKWLLEDPFVVHYAGEKPSDRPNAPWGGRMVGCCAKDAILYVDSEKGACPKSGFSP